MSPNRPRNLEEVLLPYQQAFVRDTARFKIWVAARQVGKSTALAFEAVTLAAARPKVSVCWCPHRNGRVASYSIACAAGLTLVKAGVDRGVVGRETVEEIGLANGSRIVSLPANADTVRGFSGHIFLDEFAFHRDAHAIWAAVFPIATRGFFPARGQHPQRQAGPFLPHIGPGAAKPGVAI